MLVLQLVLLTIADRLPEDSGQLCRVAMLNGLILPETDLCSIPKSAFIFDS